MYYEKIFFESRGEHKIIAEYDRLEHLKTRIKKDMLDFILGNISVLEFHDESDKDYKNATIEDEKTAYQEKIIAVFLRSFRHLDSEISSINDIEELRDFLTDRKAKNMLNAILKKLNHAKYGTSWKTLDYVFIENVIDGALEEIGEHLIDISVVRNGYVIKSIIKKKEEYEKECQFEYERWCKVHDAGNRIVEELYALGAFDDE